MPQPQCKGITATTKKRCSSPAKRGHEYCGKHLDQRTLTQEEEAQQADAERYLTQLEIELSKSLPKTEASAWTQLIRVRLAGSPEFAQALAAIAHQSEEEFQRRVRELAAVIVKQSGSPSSSSGTDIITTASTYLAHTSQDIDAFLRSLCSGTSGEGWRNDLQALTRTYTHRKVPHHVQLEVSPLEQQLGFGVEILEQLTCAQDADAIFAVLYICELLTPPFGSPPNPHWIDLNDVLDTIGWIATDSNHRKELHSKLWHYLMFGERARVIGERSGRPYRDPDTRQVIPTEISSSLWRIMGQERPMQLGLFANIEAPVRLQLVLSLEWARLLSHPITAQYLPLGEVLGKIKGGQPSGAWAKVIGLSLINTFRREPQLILANELKLTREELLTRYIPKKAPVQELLNSKDPDHARQYWRAAIRTLVSAGIVENIGEAELCRINAVGTRPTNIERQDWQQDWLKEIVDLRPGPALIDAVKERADARPPSRLQRYTGATQSRKQKVTTKNFGS